MGLQQILLVVLGVILVGVAITVGILMFSNQAYRSNVNALVSEMNEFAALAFQYWKMPSTMGGAGQVEDFVDMEYLANYIGFTAADSKVVMIT